MNPSSKASMKPLNSQTHDDEIFSKCENVKNSSYSECSNSDEIFIEDLLYKVVPGEKIDHRYWVHSQIGKGSFGVVIKAYDYVTKVDVAIKIIKKKSTFIVQGENEIKVLQLINKYNKPERYPIIELQRNFWWKGYLCLVYPLLSLNLYQLLHTTEFNGVSLSLTRKFALQILRALSFIHSNDIKVIHCDLKPENILLIHPKCANIKLIDFGSSLLENGTHYRYVQSRFYRSPEVLLELEYGYCIDMWSLACILIEMHTGKPIYKCNDESELMVRMVEICGYPPDSMIISSPKKDKFFSYRSDVGYFLNSETVGKYKNFQPKSKTLWDVLKNTLRTRMGSEGHTMFEYDCFVDFLSKIFVYNTSFRLTAQQSLHHPFIRQPPKPQASTELNSEMSYIQYQRKTKIRAPQTSDINSNRKKSRLKSEATVIHFPTDLNVVKEPSKSLKDMCDNLTEMKIACRFQDQSNHVKPVVENAIVTSNRKDSTNDEVLNKEIS